MLLDSERIISIKSAIHIEIDNYIRRPIDGNVTADKLAEEARKMSNKDDAKNQTTYVRCEIQKCVSNLLKGIEHLLSQHEKPSRNPDGPSLHRDDFDAQVDASQELSSSCDT